MLLVSLKEQANDVLQNFDSVSSDDFLKIVEEIRTMLKNNLTQEYLAGKISAIKETDSEEEKKKLCKNLTPYLDWYVSGQ